MACRDKNTNIEKRKDVDHMKIMCAYASNISSQPLGLVNLDGLYYIESIEQGRVYEYITVLQGNEYIIVEWQQ